MPLQYCPGHPSTFCLSRPLVGAELLLVAQPLHQRVDVVRDDGRVLGSERREVEELLQVRLGPRLAGHALLARLDVQQRVVPVLVLRGALELHLEGLGEVPVVLHVALSNRRQRAARLGAALEHAT